MLTFGGCFSVERGKGQSGLVGEYVAIEGGGEMRLCLGPIELVAEVIETGSDDFTCAAQIFELVKLAFTDYRANPDVQVSWLPLRGMPWARSWQFPDQAD